MPKKSSKFKKPFVSIIIRAKNEAKTIGKVLGALAKQTFQNFEVIIVNDSSTDQTLEIVKKFKKSLPIKIINLKPREFNFSYALNLGASKAKGEYLCSIAGHSLPITDTWLASGLTHFQNPQVAGVTGHYSEVPVGYFSRPLGRLFLPPWETSPFQSLAN